MNTETLVNTNNKEVQTAKSIDLSPPSGKKDADRANCGNGVCEVAWKPYNKTTKAQRSSKKNSA